MNRKEATMIAIVATALLATIMTATSSTPAFALGHWNLDEDYVPAAGMANSDTESTDDEEESSDEDSDTAASDDEEESSDEDSDTAASDDEDREALTILIAQMGKTQLMQPTKNCKHVFPIVMEKDLLQNKKCKTALIQAIVERTALKIPLLIIQMRSKKTKMELPKMCPPTIQRTMRRTKTTGNKHR